MEFSIKGSILVILIAYLIAICSAEEAEETEVDPGHPELSGFHPEYQPESDDGDEFELEDSVFINDIPKEEYDITYGTNIGNMSDEEILRLQLGVQFFAFPNKNNRKQYSEVMLGDRHSLARSGLIPGQPVHIFAHGFGGKAPQRKHFSIINAYMRENTPNVIVVNYQSADPGIGEIPIVMGVSYFSAQWRYAPSTGQRIADFIVFLKKNEIIKDASQVHLIGHSLGGHVMGVAGHRLRTQYGMKVGRITGLDVAGPLYDRIPMQNKLDYTDASFVDVIHTNIDGVGIAHAIGHVDYYANGGLGRNQNACQFRNGLVPVVSYVKTVICAHDQRPIRIWGYGISKRSNLLACPCSSRYRKRIKVKKVKFQLAGVNDNSTSPVIRSESNSELGAESAPGRESMVRRQGELCARPSNRNCIKFGEYTPSSSRGRYYLPISDRTFRQIMDSSRRNES